MVFTVMKCRVLSLVERMILMDVYVQIVQKRKEKKDGSGRFMVRTSLSIHMSKISSGHVKTDSEYLRLTLK